MSTSYPYQWFTTGDAFYGAVLSEIGKARSSIRLEMYIYMAGQPGDAIRDALREAALRGVRVRILLDAFGSYELSSDYWIPLTAAGGEVLFFNPFSDGRYAFRDHRKLLIIDDSMAFVTGFNITSQEVGDGVTRGWRDLGLSLSGPTVHDLTASFDRMFSMAGTVNRRLPRFPLPTRFRLTPQGGPLPVLLTSGPGQRATPIKKALFRDLRQAGRIRIISAYFLPSRRIRRTLIRAARVGRDVKIITAGKTDVALARYAGRALYHRLLQAGVQIYEYEAQILHSKLIIADDVVYVGSANLDTRSLNINYELLVRIEDPRLAREARQIFEDYLPHSRTIDRRTWRQSRGWWEKLIERFSHFLLARVDPLFARRQLKKLR